MNKEILSLDRLPDETDYDYHKRLINGKLIDKTLYDVDYPELSKYVYGKEYSSDVARRMMYGSCRTLSLIDKQTYENITNKEAEEVLESINKSRMELRKERYKLQTEKVEYNRWIREDARDELFEEKVIDAIRANVGIVDIPDKIVVSNKNRCGVLCIADCHFGKEYKIYGVNNEVINEYSPEIFYKRMEQIYSETLEIIKRENLESIYVFNLGDSTEGFIRNSQLWSLRYGVIDSAIIFGNYIGYWLNKLSKNVRVIYSQTDGNHDELRLLDGKKGEHLCESSGKVIRNCIKVINEFNPNFEYSENKTGFIYENICGYNVLGIHGEVQNLPNSISEFSNIYDVKISYLLSGHKHFGSYENCGVKKASIGIGSVVGSDEYSMKLRKSADATASFIIFEEDKGKVDEHTIVLN